MQTNWMTKLPEEVKMLQLNKLAIPGSHNSGAYDLTSALAPDAPKLLWKFSNTPGFARFVNNFIKPWCNCQKLSIQEQLMRGIRYLDLRVSTSSKDCDFYLVHGLYGPKVLCVLNSIKDFLETHPKEVVILDFNHFYKMEGSHHKILISQIISVFENRLCEIQSLEALSLKNLMQHRKQVICIYHHKEASKHKGIWPKESICSPWPATKSPEVCMTKLTDYMQAASSNSMPKNFFVCQGILTPDTWHIMSQRGGLHRLNQSLRPALLSWLQDTPTRWPYQTNIVIHDFVDEDNYIPIVISLNKHRAAPNSSSFSSFN